MTDRQKTDAAARAWVAGYLKAWGSSDEADISALFELDAEYRFDPWSEPERGIEAIVSAWLRTRDEPDTFSFTWEVVGVDGDRAFIQAETVYNADADHGARTYSNLWVVDFSAGGRARSFTEWYMKQ